MQTPARHDRVPQEFYPRRAQLLYLGREHRQDQIHCPLETDNIEENLLIHSFI